MLPARVKNRLLIGMIRRCCRLLIRVHTICCSDRTNSFGYIKYGEYRTLMTKTWSWARTLYGVTRMLMPVLNAPLYVLSDLGYDDAQLEEAVEPCNSPLFPSQSVRVSERRLQSMLMRLLLSCTLPMRQNAYKKWRISYWTQLSNELRHFFVVNKFYWSLWINTNASRVGRKVHSSHGFTHSCLETEYNN